ncbi:MAG: hypothetical protein QOE70_2104 [Chthoniobacter sp.]|jgi:hypothetical protein|nr:hypothetical protein [Chthoniobacter sp.]
MHESGRLALKTRGGKTISKAQARETGKRVRVKAHAGTGNSLSEQDTRELYLAARAGIVEKLMQGDCPLSVAWISGARAARKCLYMATREQTFSSRERAITAHDKAREYAFGESRETDQMSLARWAQALSESDATPNAIVRKAYARARRALRVFYAGRKNYPRKAFDYARDVETLRELARTIWQGGILRASVRERGKGEYERLRQFGERMQSAFQCLDASVSNASETRETRATRATPSARATMELPSGRAEHCAYDLARGHNHHAEFLLGRKRATRAEVESLAAMFNH